MAIACDMSCKRYANVRTNADHIRQMGNNELALFFWAYVDGKGNSLEQWREWLKQDVCEKAFNKLTELTTNREEGE